MKFINIQKNTQDNTISITIHNRVMGFLFSKWVEEVYTAKHTLDKGERVQDRLWLEKNYGGACFQTQGWFNSHVNDFDRQECINDFMKADAIEALSQYSSIFTKKMGMESKDLKQWDFTGADISNNDIKKNKIQKQNLEKELSKSKREKDIKTKFMGLANKLEHKTETGEMFTSIARKFVKRKLGI